MCIESLAEKPGNRLALAMGLCLIALAFSLQPCNAEIMDRAVFRGNTYYLLGSAGPDDKRFDQLEAEAVSLGGHLTSVNSQAEQDFIWARWGKENRNLCIGFTDRAEEGKWVWLNGEPVVYTNWSPNRPYIGPQPGFGDSDYAWMHWREDGKWIDMPICGDYGVAKVPGIPPPTLTSVVNTASYIPGGLPNEGIARGAMFAVFGSYMGPETLARAGPVPLPAALGGTSVKVTVGTVSVDCFLVYTSDSQLAAVLPSRTPVGPGTLTVTYQGRASDPVPIRVVESAFGIFTRNQAGFGPAIAQNFVSPAEMPLNALTQSAAPGQAVVLWGTGLGPITGNDAALPPVGNLPVDVEVLLGGVMSVRPFYAGRSPQFPAIDQVNFLIPENAPQGCYVPVAVRAGDRISNYGSISISPQGKYCSDSVSFAAETLQAAERNGGLRIGLIQLQRAVVTDTSGATLDRDDDVDARFYRQTLNSLLAGAEPWGFPAPPPGTCTVFANPVEDSPLPADLMRASRISLDAGPAITIKGPKGTLRLNRMTPSGEYQREGGDFVEAGLYAADNASGGAHIGGFTASLNATNVVTWTNKASLATVSRASDLTVTWTGGDLADGIVAVLGRSDGGARNGNAAFVCMEQAATGSFRVPVRILSSLPATANGSSMLMVVAVQGRSSSTFTAPGLDLSQFRHTNVALLLAKFQ